MPSELNELFEAQVARTPEAVAVELEDLALSYEDLNRRANQLARYLQELGVRLDARVAICMERSLEMIIGIFAVLKAGGAYVPLDPGYPVERLQFVLQDSKPTVVLTQSHLRGLFSQISFSPPILDFSHAGEWSNQPTSNLKRTDLTFWHLAYVIYTSGSTGVPKGVMVEHRALCNRIMALQTQYQINAQDRLLQFAPTSFDASVEEIFCALLSGAALVLRTHAWLAGGKAFWALCASRDISVLDLPTRFWQQILEDGAVRIPRSVRLLIIGGEAADLTALDRWFKRKDYDKPKLLNTYGPTEGIIVASVQEVTFDTSHWQSVGRPVTNTRIYLLDVHGQPVPVGVTGELYIGGAGLARGYLNLSDQTAERFGVDPFAGEPGARMYRTGDLGRWLEDDSIEFVGRNDFQIKIRGYRIELGEIEKRLAEHPGVREAVVVAREDHPGEKRLVAYVTAAGPPADGATAAKTEVEALRAHLMSLLPEYMVPAAYMQLEKLPLMANGKLDRKALPAPDADAYVMRGYEAPVGEIETIIARIWREVLKLEEVGRNDNFFELGGHSLLAVSVIEGMCNAGLPVDVPALFAAPTLKSLAQAVGDQRRTVAVPPNLIPEGSTAITPGMLPLVSLNQSEIDKIVDTVPGGAANIQEIYPLGPLQEGILFHHLIEREGDPFLTIGLLSFDSRTRLDRYLKALQAVINRHDILHTAMAWEGLREPVQVVWREAKLRVEEVQLKEDGGDAAEELYRRYDPRRYRIDVTQAPLLSVYVAHDPIRDRWLMLLLLHHLMGDHATLEVMQEEIHAYLLGQEEQLPPPVPFRNLVAEVRLGVSQEEHKAFFRKMLADVEEPTAPFGLLEVLGSGRGVEEARVELDPRLARRIRKGAQRLGVSAASICHVAWARVVAHVSGREDVVFGTVLFGRMHGGAGAGRALGLFINTLPIRLQVGYEGVRASVQRTHGVLAELLRHEHASLMLAQRCSAVSAPAPLFSALLNYVHTTEAPQSLPKKGLLELRAWEGMEWLRSEERSNFPFILTVDDLGERFVLSAQTVASIDPRRVCEYTRMALASLVDALEEEPGRAVSRVEVLPAAEREQALYGWNDTRKDFFNQKCVHELFEEQVERTPEAVAVVDGDATLSYGELNRRANRLAHHLGRLGVKPDTRVGICAQCGLDVTVALAAVLKAGAACVPLNATYPSRWLNFILQDSGASVLLTQAHLRQQFVGAAPLRLVDLGNSGEWAGEQEGNLEHWRSRVSPEHLAYVIYTSGSSAEPKGVMVTHDGIVRLVRDREYMPLGCEDVIGQPLSTSFDGAIFVMWTALLRGGRLVQIEKDELLNPALRQDVLRKKQINMLFVTTALLDQIARAGGEMFDGLRYLLFDGEEVDSGWVRRVLQEGRIEHFWHVYGAMETVSCRSWHEARMIEEGVKTPIGRPTANTRIYVLDARGEPVGKDVRGELYIGGAGLGRGYLNRPEMTGERFVPDPYGGEPGGRMYRTGDMGKWREDGVLEYVERADEQVEIQGYRIKPREIEARMKEYRQVEDAVVVVREDVAGEKHLVAYYTVAKTMNGGDENWLPLHLPYWYPNSGKVANENEKDYAEIDVVGVRELRGYLLERMPEYMVPTAYVLLEQVPLTATGKVDLKALPAPDEEAMGLHRYEMPEGEIETAVAGIWANVLKVERVGRRDNFFELGGRSLLAVQVAARVRQILDVELTIRDIFEHSTLSSLAEQIINLKLSTFRSEDLVQLLKEIKSQPSID
ncbi:MAG TPA: amino acid adenylation domain-containing protein [Candidatus Angelobacter sp.]|nr:amino acid adenylation domain-containing protein [Candidatus Angelobacter sp.]